MNKARVASSVVAIAAACNQPSRDTGSQAVTVTLPVGDAQAGRKAFDLKCTACHAVPSESKFPAPVSANPGPPIDARLAGRDTSYLATAIVSPSHELSPGMDDKVRAQLAGVLSPMGDFGHFMTVRQLVDIEAYPSLSEVGRMWRSGLVPPASMYNADSEIGGQHAESRW